MRRHFRVAAIVFDLDGVLVDSMPAIRSYWIRWGRARGIAEEIVLSALHLPAHELVRTLAPTLDAAREAREAASSYEIEGIPALAGSHRLLGSLPSGAWAVVTSGPRDVAVRRMVAAGLPAARILIAGEDTPRGKPDPAGYLLAAGRLRMPATACLAIEDSAAGIAAAAAAGMAVIAVGPHGPAEISASVDAVVTSLEALEAKLDRERGHIDVTIAAR